MEEIQNRKLIMRIGRNTLSFTLPDPADKERPLCYEPYVVKGGISMAANLREALKTATLLSADVARVQVVLDTPSMLVPIEQFEEENINDLYAYTFAPSQEPRKILYNVLPDLKAVCLFPINKDLYGVINDRYADVQFIHALSPVWRHMHQRSFTGHFNKLYASFLGGRQLCLFAFQQNRFKFCNTFEATHAHDALYFILYVWKQLRMDVLHDELHLSGEVPEEELLMQELKQYLQKVYVSNPAAEFSQAPATKVKGMPYDLMTLIVKGR
jgi:hypothetical protein